MDQNTQREKELSDTAPIRTFQSDIAEALKNQQGSIIKIAVLEQEKKQAQEQFIETKKKNGPFFLIFGILLILSAIGIFLYYTLVLKEKNREAEIVTLSTKRNFINGDHITPVLQTNTVSFFESLMITEKQLNISVGSIEQLLPTKKIDDKNTTLLSITELFNAFNVEAPENILRSLAPESYLFGIYQTTQSNYFILLKTTVFSNTFSQMLIWEPTLATSFQKILKITEDTGLPITFKDIIIKNEDVRVGYIGDKQIIAYTFFGHKKELLLLAQNTDILESLISRFTKKLIEQ